MDLARFRRLPLLGILRGIVADDVEPLAEAMIGAGLTAIEVTMNTPDAPARIARLCAVAGERLMVGAGTVLDLDALAAARAAGASFIVMPTLVPAVVERCTAEHVPVFPGALTPQEIHTAWTAGATMVKIFPAAVFGPTYLREIKGPFDRIELMAVGGVTADNLSTYFACGAAAVAFGASIFRRDWLAARAYDQIATEVRRLVTACAAARPAG
jgi:2-dehydro-3-deoxyphosphogluconate aldolase/(4S)-4-hydroxy-2-oxoglutarate aldolase